MEFADKYTKPIEGFFKIETYENGKLTDTFEEKNMIMKASKRSVRNSIGGKGSNVIEPTDYQGQIKMSTFIMGDMGNVSDNILAPKSFSYDREDLFSVEDPNGKPYPITFRDDGTGNIIVDREGYDPKYPISNPESSNVTINFNSGPDTEELEFIIEIPEGNAVTSGNVAVFTEAALYTNLDMNIIDFTGTNPTINKYGTIFSMRTFPAKVKTDTTAFRIIWKIIF